MLLVPSRRELGASGDARLSKEQRRFRCRCSSSTGKTSRGRASAATARRVTRSSARYAPRALVPFAKRVWELTSKRRLWQDTLGETRVCAAERLYAVEERVRRGRTALHPLREAVAACAAVVGRHIDRARRAALDHLSLDARASQRAVLEPGADGRPDLSPRGVRLGRGAVGKGVCHGYLAAERFPMSLALTMCDSSAAIVARLAFNPLAMSPVVLRG